MPRQNCCVKPKHFNRYSVIGAITSGITLCAGFGLTLFAANRISSHIDSSLNGFITNLFSKNITIPTPEMNVPVPSIDLPVNLSSEFLVEIFNNLLKNSHINISSEALQRINYNYTIHVQTPPDIVIPIQATTVSFSLLNVIGSSLDSVTSGVKTLSNSVGIAFLVIGFMFSLLIANAVLEKFQLLAHERRGHKQNNQPSI